MQHYLAQGVCDALVQLGALLSRAFAEGQKDFGEVGDQCFFEDLSGNTEHFDVLLLLLQLHVVIRLGEQTQKQDHVLVVCYLSHHELADLFLADMDGVRQRELGQRL